MKPYALPGEGRAHGFYTGPAPKGTSKLPRRKPARAARAPRNPFAMLEQGQRELIRKGLGGLGDGALGSAEAAAARDELIALLDAAE